MALRVDAVKKGSACANVEKPLRKLLWRDDCDAGHEALL